MFLILFVAIGVDRKKFHEPQLRQKAQVEREATDAAAPSATSTGAASQSSPETAKSSAVPTMSDEKAESNVTTVVLDVGPQEVTLVSAVRPSPEGHIEKVRLVRVEGSKYPLQRVVEVEGKGLDGQAARTTMVADHVMVRLQPDVSAEQVRATVSQVPGLAVR